MIVGFYYDAGIMFCTRFPLIVKVLHNSLQVCQL